MLHEEPMMKFKKGKTSEKDFWEFAVKYWNVNISPKELIELLPKHYKRNEEVYNFIKDLKRDGYKTCVCSNNFVTRVNKLQEKFNFLDDFDVVVFSYEVGVLKPDKKIFEELVSRSEVRPNEIIYSDDNSDKLSGANTLGIQTFVFKDF